MVMQLEAMLLGRSPWGTAIIALLLLYGIVNLMAWFISERMIFHPPTPTYSDSPDSLKLTSCDRRQISALYLPNPGASYTLLYSHGNSSDLGTCRGVLEALRQLGFAVFAYDYQGYGTSQGAPSEQNTYHDITAAYHYLTQTLNIPPHQIILYGFSVGSGPSLELARHHQVAGIILEGAFISTFRVMTGWPLLLVDRFRNLTKLKSIRYPILIIHGKRDQVIPFNHGECLFQHATPPKQFFAVEQANHHDLIDVAGDRYSQELLEFVQVVKLIDQHRINS